MVGSSSSSSSIKKIHMHKPVHPDVPATAALVLGATAGAEVPSIWVGRGGGRGGPKEGLVSLRLCLSNTSVGLVTMTSCPPVCVERGWDAWSWVTLLTLGGLGHHDFLSSCVR
jgi:hypothetical protein